MCYCLTCKKYFHPLGIMGHRAAHRRRFENCAIRFTYGNIESYNYSELRPTTPNNERRD